MPLKGQEQAGRASRRGSWARTIRRLKWGIFAVLAVVLVVLLLYNRAPVTLDIFGWKHRLPLCVWLLLAFAAGAAGGIGVRLLRRKRR